MCGISCVIALDEQARKTNAHDKVKLSNRLDKSLEKIRHRGPDSSGKWISADGRVALGHVRLEINDLTPTGSQPLHSTDGTVHTVVNGEIYDYERLRKEMEDTIDYKFQGTSDCELVLALYKHYGISFLSKIRGEYSICLFDEERELFIAVRDRYGIKPLFWTVQNGELWIAAEMKAFLPLGWKPEWDVNGIVGGDFQITNSTIFKKVQKVQPGHFLICRSFGTVHEKQYWDADYPDKDVKDHRTEEEMIRGVREHLLDAIKQRLRADVKVGVSLSGGIDSSVVAGMVNHLIREGHKIGSESENERLSCFGIAFDEDSGFDESATANRTADFLGVKFYKKHMNEQELANSFEDATWLDEQPNPDLNFIGTYALSELFREKGFRVNINGQGSDEIFGGYNIFLPDFLREPDDTFKSNDPASVVPESLRMSELQKSEEVLNEIYNFKLDLTSGKNGHPPSPRRQLNNTLTPAQMALAFPDLPMKKEVLSKINPKPKLNAVDAQVQTYASSLPDPSSIHTKIASKWHPLHTAQYIFTKAHLQNLLLSNLGDRGEMAHSIEGRVPFLDHHLTEYVNSLPPSMKIRYDSQNKNWTEKYALREAGRPFITDEIYTKKKHPYSAPLKYPVGGPLYKLLKRLVTEENAREFVGFLDPTGVGALVDTAFGVVVVDGGVNGGGDGDRSGKHDNKIINQDGDKQTFKLVICLAQWVVLGQRFGVRVPQ